MKSVFVVGPGRSGTSLLQSILDSHSDIEFFKENQFLRMVFFEKGNIKKFIKEKHKRIDYLNYNNITDFDDPILFYKKLKYLIQSTSKTSLKYIGDKDPRLVDYVDKIPVIFKDSKIIVLHRNPGDIVLSRTKADWSKKWPFFVQVTLVFGQLEFYKQNRESISNCRLFDVSYEHLITDTKATLKTITEFLEIEYEHEMLDFQKSSNRLTSNDELQWKKNIFNKIDSSNSNRWKVEFSESRKFLIHKVFNNYYSKDIMSFKLSFFKRILLHVYSLFIIHLSKLYFLRVNK